MWLVKSKSFFSLGLRTSSRLPKNNTLQNVYMIALFVSFGTKTLYWGGKLVHNISLGLCTSSQLPKNNTLQNVYMTVLFVSFGTKTLYWGGKFVHNIYGNPNSHRVDKPSFFPNLYKLHNLYIWPCPLEESLSKVLSPPQAVVWSTTPEWIVPTSVPKVPNDVGQNPGWIGLRMMHTCIPNIFKYSTFFS
jgi:hypothetical protein